MNPLYIPASAAPNVLEVTTSASSLQTITLDANGGTFVPGYYRFICDADVWLKFSSDGATVTDPVISDETGDGGECWLLPACTEILIQVKDSQKKFKAIAKETTYLRYFFEQRG